MFKKTDKEIHELLQKVWDVPVNELVEALKGEEEVPITSTIFAVLVTLVEKDPPPPYHPMNTNILRDNNVYVLSLDPRLNLPIFVANLVVVREGEAVGLDETGPAKHTYQEWLQRALDWIEIGASKAISSGNRKLIEAAYLFASATPPTIEDMVMDLIVTPVQQSAEPST